MPKQTTVSLNTDAAAIYQAHEERQATEAMPYALKLAALAKSNHELAVRLMKTAIDGSQNDTHIAILENNVNLLDQHLAGLSEVVEDSRVRDARTSARNTNSGLSKIIGLTKSNNRLIKNFKESIKPILNELTAEQRQTLEQLVRYDQQEFFKLNAQLRTLEEPVAFYWPSAWDNWSGGRIKGLADQYSWLHRPLGFREQAPKDKSKALSLQAHAQTQKLEQNYFTALKNSSAYAVLGAFKLTAKQQADYKAELDKKTHEYGQDLSKAVFVNQIILAREDKPVLDNIGKEVEDRAQFDGVFEDFDAAQKRLAETDLDASLEQWLQSNITLLTKLSEACEQGVCTEEQFQFMEDSSLLLSKILVHQVSLFQNQSYIQMLENDLAVRSTLPDSTPSERLLRIQQLNEFSLNQVQEILGQGDNKSQVQRLNEQARINQIQDKIAPQSAIIERLKQSEQPKPSLMSTTVKAVSDIWNYRQGPQKAEQPLGKGFSFNDTVISDYIESFTDSVATFQQGLREVAALEKPAGWNKLKQNVRTKDTPSAAAQQKRIEVTKRFTEQCNEICRPALFYSSIQHKEMDLLLAEKREADKKEKAKWGLSKLFSRAAETPTPPPSTDPRSHFEQMDVLPTVQGPMPVMRSMSAQHTQGSLRVAAQKAEAKQQKEHEAAMKRRANIFNVQVQQTPSSESSSSKRNSTQRAMDGLRGVNAFQSPPRKTTRVEEQPSINLYDEFDEAELLDGLPLAPTGSMPRTPSSLMLVDTSGQMHLPEEGNQSDYSDGDDSIDDEELAKVLGNSLSK